MKIIDKIIPLNKKGEKVYRMSSPFGQRTLNGTKAFHYGVDYTASSDVALYAPEDIEVVKVVTSYKPNQTTSKANYGNNIVFKLTSDNIYIRLAHMNTVEVKVGKVKAGTKLGTMGKTGYCTGRHTHMEMYTESQWKKGNRGEIDGEKYEYPKKEEKSFFPARGYFKLGDRNANVARVAYFMRTNFPSYTPAAALGNYYGVNIKAAITEFQRRTGLKPDGCLGQLTLNKLIEYGFEV